MIDFLSRLAWEIWAIFREASVFLLLGFALAGVLTVFVPSAVFRRFLGRGRIRSVLWAAGIGAPVPFCSCAVVPTVLGLLRQGATKGAAVSFLISTPETGLDTIALSYALMDPLITIGRPIAGVLTALVAGVATNLWGAPRPDDSLADAAGAPAPSVPEASDIETAGPDLPWPGSPHAEATPPERPGRVRRVIEYGFHELLDATAHWLVLGIVLSALAAVLLPPSVIQSYLGGGLLTMLAMFVVAIPVYSCASASTPIAAALVLKGLSPGAALVFLLSGPATNLSALVVLSKFLGRRVMVIYLATIAGMSILAGYTLDWVYRTWEVNPGATFGKAAEVFPGPVKVGGAIVLIGLLALSLCRTAVPEEWSRVGGRLARLSGVPLTARQLAGAAAGLLALLYLGSGLFAVRPGEVALKTRFGRVVAADLGPGLHYRLPWPLEAHRIVQRDRISRIEVGFRTAAHAPVPPPAIGSAGFWDRKEKVPDEALLLTGDENIIDVAFTVQYQVKDALAYAYTLVDPEVVTRSVAVSALRAIVATTPVDAFYATARREVERRLAQTTQEILDGYHTGLRITAVSLLSVHAPGEVHAAFRDVASAQEDKILVIDRARAFEAETVNLAEGDASAMVEAARAFREQKTLEAEGDALAFGLIEREYRRAPDVTRFRLQLETLEEILPSTQKVLRPGAGHLKDFDLWVLQPFGPKKGQ